MVKCWYATLGLRKAEISAICERFSIIIMFVTPVIYTLNFIFIQTDIRSFVIYTKFITVIKLKSGIHRCTT